MHIDVEFGENLKVNTRFGDFVVESDQAKNSGGDGSSPEPFDYFLASMALCAGYYVRSFCQKRDISIEGIKITQEDSRDSENPSQRTITINIELPDEFPPKYKKAVVMAAKGCSVKKVIEQGPHFEVNLVS